MMSTATEPNHLTKEPAFIGLVTLSTAVSALVSPCLLYFGQVFAEVTPSAILTYVVVALLGAMLGMLNVVDRATRTIPNRILIPFALAIVPLVVAQTVITGDWLKLGLACAVTAGWFALTLGYTLLKPSSFGGGDLKVMPLAMLPLGLFAYWVPLVWVILSLILASARSILHRATGDGKVPFAPSMDIALPVTLGLFIMTSSMSFLPTL
ncbi:prepilin peptidase [Glutamicibacter ardleyensis]|uniref:prepilin peptidase n=1 Tax=Glutamicibacter ardleyensis TaxID=225894 RepID=UPI003FCFFB47